MWVERIQTKGVCSKLEITFGAKKKGETGVFQTLNKYLDTEDLSKAILKHIANENVSSNFADLEKTMSNPRSRSLFQNNPSITRKSVSCKMGGDVIMLLWLLRFRWNWSHSKLSSFFSTAVLIDFQSDCLRWHTNCSRYRHSKIRSSHLYYLKKSNPIQYGRREEARTIHFWWPLRIRSSDKRHHSLNVTLG